MWFLSFRFPHQNPICTSPLLHTCHMPRPSHSSRFDHPNNIWWGVGTGHKAPHYAVFSTPLLPHFSSAEISSSTPYSLTPSAYVPPSMSQTKFHTHTKKKDKTLINSGNYLTSCDATKDISRLRELTSLVRIYFTFEKKYVLPWQYSWLFTP